MHMYVHTHERTYYIVTSISTYIYTHVCTYVIGPMDCLSVLFSLINNVKPGPEQSGRPFRQISDHFSEASYHNQKLLIFVSLMKLILILKLL